MKKSPEWSLVTSLFLIICSIVLIAKVNAFKSRSIVTDEDLRVEDVSVYISGAVKKPGSYKVSPGTPLEVVIKKARPLICADLKKLPLTQLVDGTVTIVVEEMKEILVSVRGEVLKVAEYTLPVGARISDLKSKVTLTKDADKRFLSRRKLLKNGDVIEVPKKKLE